MQPPCPWPTEPERIDGAGLNLARQFGGTRTNELLLEAEALGALEPTKGRHLHIDVRVSYQQAGKFQHKRPTWHVDAARCGWIYVDGEGPTELRNGPDEWTLPLRTLTAYHGLEHRCPPQTQAGWRYFFRILWCANAPRFRLTPQQTPRSPGAAKLNP